MATVTILGAGMMGSALAVPLCDAGHEVRLVGTHLDDEIVESLKRSHHHPKLGVTLPERIVPFANNDFASAIKGSDLLALGVSSPGVHWAGERIAPYARPDLPIVMITKGLGWNSERLQMLPDVLAEHLPANVRLAVQPVAVAGPCIAGELARRVETCVVFAGRNKAQLARVQSFFTAPYYHVWKSTDVAGVETCAALKNAYAMGIAFAIGVNDKHLADPLSPDAPRPGSIAMHNYESAVFAQASYEMQRIVELVSGNPRSVTWLPGVGDLDVTCNGGRTGRFGRLLGLGIGVDRAIEHMQGATLECLDILRVMRVASAAFQANGQLKRAELPLLAHMCEVALDGKPLAMPFHSFFSELDADTGSSGSLQ